jgi:TPR repeat protein
VEGYGTDQVMDNGSERAKFVMFKPAAGGWVYRAPNPWVFGNAPHYLVNEAQKAKIEAIIIPRRPVLLGLIIALGILACVLAITGAVWLISGDEDPTTADVIAMAALTAISLLATIPIVNRTQRRRLQPILAELPLTKERITFADMRKNARTAASFRQSRNAFIASAFASFAAVFAAYSHYFARPGIDAELMTWGFNAVVFGWLALVWYRRALSKAKTTCSGCARTDEAHFVRLTRIVLVIAVASLALLIIGLQILRQHRLSTLPDYGAARALYESDAKKGIAKAMNDLGFLYEQGLGGAKDYGKAKEWYAKAAATGESKAMSNLGRLYQNGLGVPRDYATARDWFERSANAGNSSGMNSLGWLYQNGLGVKQDYAAAQHWYEKASDVGNAAGTSNLAWLYQNGWGVPIDYAKAHELHERAARAGIAFSMDALGATYINGWGVAKDSAKAREWYDKAATAGNPSGMQHLASMLDAGNGGPADPARAARLLLQSAKLGHKWSIAVLQGSLAFLGPATRTELKRELTRPGYYSGPIDDQWDDAGRAAATEYLSGGSLMAH